MFWSKTPENTLSSEAMQRQLDLLHISPEDLAANRDGRLSESQQQEYAGLMKQGQQTMLILVPLVLLIAAGGIGWQIFGSQQSGGGGLREVFSSNPIIPVVGIGGTLLVWLLLMGYGVWKTFNTKPGTIKVQNVAGKVKISVTQTWGTTAAIASAAGAATTSIIVQVGRQKIYSTNQMVEQALVNGGNYRVYFIKTGGVGYFVSAEVEPNQ